MPKDGEGKHAIWKQPFELKYPSGAGQTGLVLEAHEGSPLDSKLIGQTEAVDLEQVQPGQDPKELEIRILNQEKEDIGYVNITLQILAQDIYSDTTKKLPETAAAEDLSPQKNDGPDGQNKTTPHLAAHQVKDGQNAPASVQNE